MKQHRDDLRAHNNLRIVRMLLTALCLLSLPACAPAGPPDATLPLSLLAVSSTSRSNLFRLTKGVGGLVSAPVASGLPMGDMVQSVRTCGGRMFVVSISVNQTGLTLHEIDETKSTTTPVPAFASLHLASWQIESRGDVLYALTSDGVAEFKPSTGAVRLLTRESLTETMTHGERLFLNGSALAFMHDDEISVINLDTGARREVPNLFASMDMLGQIGTDIVFLDVQNSTRHVLNVFTGATQAADRGALARLKSIYPVWRVVTVGKYRYAITNYDVPYSADLTNLDTGAVTRVPDHHITDLTPG